MPVPHGAIVCVGGLLALALSALPDRRLPSPSIEFTESASTGIYLLYGTVHYAIKGREVGREEFRQFLKTQDAKAQGPFCPFFPEFCGEPI